MSGILPQRGTKSRKDCKKLKSVKLPDGIAYIGKTLMSFIESDNMLFSGE